MNAFQSPVQPQKPIHQQTAEEMLSTVTEFFYEMTFEDEPECQGWGAYDIELPAECWNAFFELIRTDDLKSSIRRGHVHIVNIQEIEDGDRENSVVLAGGYLDYQQKLIFKTA